MLTSRTWHVRLIGTESEGPLLEEILNGFKSEIPNPKSQIQTSIGLPLGDLMHLIASAGAVISCDSGAAHLAAALGKPCVVLFFSTEPRSTAPVGFAVRTLVAHVPCSPCFLRTCPIGYICRDAITPQDVMTHLDDIFDVPVKNI